VITSRQQEATTTQVYPEAEHKTDTSLNQISSLFWLVAAVGLFTSILPHFGISQSPFSHLEFSKFGNMFTMSTLLAPFLMNFVFKPDRREYLQPLIFSALTTTFLFFSEISKSPAITSLVCLFFFTLLQQSIKVLKTCNLPNVENFEKQKIYLFLLVPLFFHVSLFFLHFGLQLYPEFSMDFQAYNADKGFGFLVPFALGQLLEYSAVLNLAARLAYLLLPIMTGIAMAIQLSGHIRLSFDFARSFGIVAVVGFITYLIFPVSGPLDNFPDIFPAYPTFETASLKPTLAEFRNGMPSLHTAWAFLILLVTWDTLKLPLKLIGLTFFTLTEIATLGTGQHWLVDVIPSFPLCLFAYALTTRSPLACSKKWAIFGLLIYINLLLITGWFHSLYNFSAAITWLANASVVFISIFGIFSMRKKLLSR